MRGVRRVRVNGYENVHEIVQRIIAKDHANESENDYASVIRTLGHGHGRGRGRGRDYGYGCPGISEVAAHDYDHVRVRVHDHDRASESDRPGKEIKVS